MNDLPSPRRTLLTAAVVAFVLTLALLAAGKSTLFDTPILEFGDTAPNALQIDNAKSGRELYGNYSRFQFNHPGPAFFYAYAGAEIVLRDWLNLVPSPHNAHLIASIVLQAAFFSLALAILASWVRSGWFLAAALIGAALHFGQISGAFISLWPPHVLLAPFFCFAVACCSFAAGRTRDLAVMTVAGGFLFHGHVAQPLFVGGLGLLAAWFHARHLGLPLRRLLPTLWQQQRGLAWFCLGWTALFILPLLIDVLLYGRQSNVAAIIGRFTANAQDSKTVFQSLLYFLSFGSYAINQDEFLTKLGPATVDFFRGHGLGIAAWFAGILVPGALFLRRRSSLDAEVRRFIATGYLLWGAIAVLCILWGLVQSGPMFQFNGFFYYGVYFLGALLGLAVLLVLYPVPAPAPAATAAYCIAAILITRSFLLAPLNRMDSGQDLLEGVTRILAEDKQRSRRPKILVFEHYIWPDALAVALELQRRNIGFYTDHSWNFMVGRRHDVNLLGDKLTEQTDVWWIGAPTEGGTLLRPEMMLFTEPAKLDPRGAALSFGLKQNGFRHLVAGLSTGNTTSAIAEQRRVRFQFATAPVDHPVQLILDAASHQGVKVPAQPVQVRLNGQPVGEITVSTRGQYSVSVPAAIWNLRRIADLELAFPAAVPLHDYRRPALENWASIQLWHLWFATAVPFNKPAAAPNLALTITTPQTTTLPLTEAVNPAGDRLDFTATGRGARLASTGLASPEADQTRIDGPHAALLFRPQPADRDIYLEIVAHPYTTAAGQAPNQRCRLSFNGQLIFESPFTEPGVIRVTVPKHLWNATPIATLRFDLPDATAPDAPAPRSGLALRWLTVRPAEPPSP